VRAYIRLKTDNAPQKWCHKLKVGLGTRVKAKKKKTPYLTSRFCKDELDLI